MTVLIRRDLDAGEVRVLASLVEKERTTPDAYPLSLNSLRLACNQATNRDPVVSYEEADVRAALGRLGRRGWIRSSHPGGSRTIKYRHLIATELELDEAELALLAVLMLRGPQTPGELKQRSGRLHGFADLGALQETLEGLIERELVRRLDRRPGQKEERYEHLLSEAAEEGGEEPVADGVAGAGEAGFGDGAAPAVPAPGLEARLAELERTVAAIAERLERLETAPTEDEDRGTDA